METRKLQPAGRQPLRDSIGNVLLSLRAEKGFTQVEAAERAGMSNRYVGLLEMGEGTPSVEMVQRLLKVYGYELWVGKRQGGHDGH